MAYQCDYCGKGVDYGHDVSHAKNRTKRTRLPNLHTARVVEKGKVVKRRLCSKCLRRAERPEKKLKKSEPAKSEVKEVEKETSTKNKVVKKEEKPTKKQVKTKKETSKKTEKKKTAAKEDKK